MLRPPMAQKAILSVRSEAAVEASVFLFGGVGFGVTFEIFPRAESGVALGL